MPERPLTIDQVGAYTVNLPKLPDGARDFGDGIIGPSDAEIAYFNSLSDTVVLDPVNSEKRSGVLVKIGNGLLSVLDKIPSRVKRPLTATTAAVALGAVAAACSGGSEADVSKKTAEPTQKPPATETIAPTPTTKPTEIPTVAPTEVPTEPPATIEGVRNAFDAGYSKLDAATLAGLPLNQSRAYIEERLAYCNGELIIQDIPLDHPNYNYALINACIAIPQEVIGIPGHEDILEFSDAIEKLGSFTLAKVDKLYESGQLLKEENGQNVPITRDEFEPYRAEVAAYFPK